MSMREVFDGKYFLRQSRLMAGYDAQYLIATDYAAFVNVRQGVAKHLAESLSPDMVACTDQFICINEI